MRLGPVCALGRGDVQEVPRARSESDFVLCQTSENLQKITKGSVYRREEAKVPSSQFQTFQKVK